MSHIGNSKESSQTMEVRPIEDQMPFSPQIDRITADTLRDYHRQYYIGPRMALAASGVEHSELVSLAQKYFKVSCAHVRLLVFIWV